MTKTAGRKSLFQEKKPTRTLKAPKLAFVMEATEIATGARVEWRTEGAPDLSGYHSGRVAASLSAIRVKQRLVLP
jgi:hypothetical protein